MSYLFTSVVYRIDYDMIMFYILTSLIYREFPTRMVYLYNHIEGFRPEWCISSRVPDQNGVSLQYIMLEIHHSGWGPSTYRNAILVGNSRCGIKYKMFMF